MRGVLGQLGAGLLLLPFHAEVSRLPMLSQVAELHVGAGSRERGRCPPELVFTLASTGDLLDPRPEASSPSSRGRAGGSFGMTLIPLRSCWGGHEVSMFNLEMAHELSGAGSSAALQVGVLRVDFSF